MNRLKKKKTLFLGLQIDNAAGITRYAMCSMVRFISSNAL